MFSNYLSVAKKSITRNVSCGGVSNTFITLINQQQRSLAFKPTAVLFKSKKKKNKQLLKIDQLTTAITKTTTQLATQIESIQQNQQQKQQQNDKAKVENSPLVSLDLIINLPFIPPTINYSLNNNNVTNLEGIIELNKSDSTINDDDYNWNFFKSGLFWFKDELKHLDKELEFDTITNTKLLKNNIGDKIIQLETQIIEQLEKTRKSGNNIVNENYFINLIKIYRFKELYNILENLKDNESIPLLKQFKNIIILPKYEFYRYLIINEIFSNKKAENDNYLDNFNNMDEFYYYLRSTNIIIINIAQTDNYYYKVCPKLYEISKNSIFPNNIIAKQLLDMITQLKLIFGKDETTIMPWQKVNDPEISLPIYHITNDSINNYIFSFFILIKFDIYQVLMDNDFCFNDIDKFKFAFDVKFVEPSKQTMLYIILQDQERIKKLFNDPKISKLYHELLSKGNR